MTLGLGLLRTTESVLKCSRQRFGHHVKVARGKINSVDFSRYGFRSRRLQNAPRLKRFTDKEGVAPHMITHSEKRDWARHFEGCTKACKIAENLRTCILPSNPITISDDDGPSCKSSRSRIRLTQPMTTSFTPPPAAIGANRCEYADWWNVDGSRADNGYATPYTYYEEDREQR